jgi:hypothetical protein
VCSCVRVRALTMRECAACVRVRRALFVRPSIDGTCTYTVYVYGMYNNSVCMYTYIHTYIHTYVHTYLLTFMCVCMCASVTPSLCNPIDGTRRSIYYMYTPCMHVSLSMRVWLHGRTGRRCGPAAHTRPRAASVRARVCECAQLGRTHIRADTCERVPSAWTACGSARRRSSRRRRSTRTSARGTRRALRRWLTYARCRCMPTGSSRFGGALGLEPWFAWGYCMSVLARRSSAHMALL